MTQEFSRRAILQGLSASAVAGMALPDHAFAEIDDQPFYFLSDDEARFLASICDVLIPEDEFPSASQAGVVDFIDLQLSGPYGQGAGLYMKGPFPQGIPEQGYQVPMVPADLFRRAMSAAQDQIRDLDGDGLMTFVQSLSDGEADLGDVPAKPFFDELWTLTNQGYFADPMYGGNARYAGWEMVGFPGAHAYYLSFVDKFNMPYNQPPMGINHRPGSDGAMPRPIPTEGG